MRAMRGCAVPCVPRCVPRRVRRRRSSYPAKRFSRRPGGGPRGRLRPFQAIHGHAKSAWITSVGQRFGQSLGLFVSGSGSIFITATKSLDASVSGSGAVLYTGNPQDVTRSITYGRDDRRLAQQQRFPATRGPSPSSRRGDGCTRARARGRVVGGFRALPRVHPEDRRSRRGLEWARSPAALSLGLPDRVHVPGACDC